MALFLQAVADGLQMGLLYALVAVGLAIIWGLMEMINFAHGEFMMLGMFGAWGLSVALGWDPLVSMVPIAVLMYGGGVLVYRLLMEQVQRGEVFTQIFATVGLFFFVQNGVVALFTSDYRFVSKSWLTGLSGVNITLGGVRIGVPLLVGGLIALILFLILYLLIDRTDFGLALQARGRRGRGKCQPALQGDRPLPHGRGLRGRAARSTGSGRWPSSRTRCSR